MLPVPLFVCHANCCRSVMAQYLYESLRPGLEALSAGVEVGPEINDRAAAMLRCWGIDARRHKPRQINRELCGRADAIFAMGPEYLVRLLGTCGSDLATKAYLFADPFSQPPSLLCGEYLVPDPSFEARPVAELVQEFAWFRQRVVQIHETLKGDGPPMVPASRYLSLLDPGMDV